MASIDEVNGKHRVRWRVNGKQRARTFSTHKQALTFKAQIETDLARGVASDPALGRVTFKDWYAEFTASRLNVKPITKGHADGLYRVHLAPHWDTWKLESITRRDVQAWVGTIQRSPRTVRAAYKVLSQSLNAAVKAGYIPKNPCSDVNLPAIDHEELNVLDYAEIHRLAEAIDGRYSALILTLAYSGIRIGEAAALKWPQVDLEAGTLRVIASSTEGQADSRPKSKAGVRTIPLPQVLVDSLSAHKANFSRAGYVFTSRDGQQLRARNFNRRAYASGRKAAQIRDDLKVHDLRHTAISLWIRNGVDLVRVMKWAGHHDAAFTLNTYGHLFPTDDVAVMERLNARILEATATASDRSEGS